MNGHTSIHEMTTVYTNRVRMVTLVRNGDDYEVTVYDTTTKRVIHQEVELQKGDATQEFHSWCDTVRMFGAHIE